MILLEKVCVKATCPSVKKVKKSRKWFSRALLIFTGKNAACVNILTIYPNLIINCCFPRDNPDWPPSPTPISWWISCKSQEPINLRWLTSYPHPHFIMHFLEISGTHKFEMIDLLPPPPFSVFFFPWKSKCLPWKFLSIFGIPSVKNFFLPWKYPKKLPVKHLKCTWKFLWNHIRENGNVRAWKISLTLSMKFAEIHLFFCP